MANTERKPRLALVGCGSLSERGILPHLALQNVKISCLCDISAERVETLAARFDIEQRYTQYEELLKDSTLDAVLIASPMHLHYVQAQAALKSGKHVYVQKTMAGTVAEARALLHLADECDRVLAASPGQILLPAFTKAAQIIEDGEIGVPYSALAVNWAPGHEHEPCRQDTSNPAMDPSWYYRRGSGPLRDMGIYALHGLIGLFGSVEEVFAYSSTPVKEKSWGNKLIPVETADNYSLNMRFRNGALAQVVTGYCAMPELIGWGHLSIVGSDGALDLRRVPGFGSRYELILRKNQSNTSQHFTFGSGLGEDNDAIDEAHVALDILDFVEAVSNQRPPGASARTALEAIAVVEAAERSVCARLPQAL